MACSSVRIRISCGTPFSAFSWSNAPMKSRFMAAPRSGQTKTWDGEPTHVLGTQVQILWFADGRQNRPEVYPITLLSATRGSPLRDRIYGYTRGATVCELALARLTRRNNCEAGGDDARAHIDGRRGTAPSHWRTR